MIINQLQVNSKKAVTTSILLVKKSNSLMGLLMTGNYTVPQHSLQFSASSINQLLLQRELCTAWPERIDANARKAYLVPVHFTSKHF